MKKFIALLCLSLAILCTSVPASAEKNEVASAYVFSPHQDATVNSVDANVIVSVASVDWLEPYSVEAAEVKTNKYNKHTNYLIVDYVNLYAKANKELAPELFADSPPTCADVPLNVSLKHQVIAPLNQG